MLPTNIFKAASDNGQLLGVILFSILFGFFAGRLPDNLRIVQKQFWESFQAVILKLTDWIIGFAPIGVFGLVLPILYNAPIGDLIQTLSVFFDRITWIVNPSARCLRYSCKTVYSYKPFHSLEGNAPRSFDCIFNSQFISYASFDYGCR